MNSPNTTVTATEPDTTRPAAKTLALAAVAGVICYVAIDVVLKFLRPEYSLLHNAESDYGRGPWFWVMDLNFLLRCALSLAIAVAISRSARMEGRLRAGQVLLVIWATCSGLLALGSATRHPHAPGGMYERIFLGLELLWIAIAAWHIATKPPTPERPNA